MSQVELPQLSLQRYVELVKRRRWQLVPVSLLGLIIGGLIAFFIPRYFVAETLLVHQQVPGADPTDTENPFREVVDTAKSTMPLAIEEALDQLKWPEAQSGDPYDRAQYVRQLGARLDVQDGNAWEKSRSYAQLRVVYKDRDGVRAADFLNTLVQVWIKKRIAELREPAQQRSLAAKNEADSARRLLFRFLEEKQTIERDYRIQPDVELSVQRGEWPRAIAEQQRMAGELRQKEAQQATLQARLAVDVERLAGLEPRVPEDQQQLEVLAAKTPQGVALLLQMQAYQRNYESVFNPGTQQWHQSKLLFEQAREQLRALVPEAQPSPDGMVPNVEYTVLEQKVQEQRALLAGLDAEIAALRAATAEEGTRLAQLVQGYALYEGKQLEVEAAKKLLEDAQQEEADAKSALTMLTRHVPVEVMRKALTPPRPTDPNILVVAMIGCVLGLGAAIGLILLLDFLQGTFKTVEEVERVLHVPVLGGISHLETEAERDGAVRSRRRATLAAAAVLFLVTLVVVIYYVDSTRLPPVVRNLLAMLLGA